MENTLQNVLDNLRGSVSSMCLCQVDFNSTKDCFSHYLRINNESSPHSEQDLLIFGGVVGLILDLYTKQMVDDKVCCELYNILNKCFIDDPQSRTFLLYHISLDNSFLAYTISKITSSMVYILPSDNVTPFLEIVCNKWDPNVPNSTRVFEILANIVFTVPSTTNPNKPGASTNNCITKSVNYSSNTNNINLVLKLINKKWKIWSKFYIKKISSQNVSNCIGVMEFLNLWEKLIDFTNKNKNYDNKVLLSQIQNLAEVLATIENVHIYCKILDILLKTLNYGHEICIGTVIELRLYSLSMLITSSLLGSKICELMPKLLMSRTSDQCYFLDSCGTIPHKVTLLLLESLAAQEKYLATSQKEENAGQIVETKLEEISSFIKKQEPNTDEDNLGSLIVNLCADQDSWLIEAMLCCLDIHLSLQPSSQQKRRNQVDPHHIFIKFLETIHNDHQVLLDFLISNETSFLIYLLKYLKTFHKEWESVQNLQKNHIFNIVTVLRKLKTSIEKLVLKDLFPYNIKPILKWISSCDHLYVSSYCQNSSRKTV